jgi:hypothetical protein
MYVSKGGVVVATTHSQEDGTYHFCVGEDEQPYFCVPAGTGYTVDGWVIIDGTLYSGLQPGIEVFQGQDTGPVAVILFP